VGLPWFNLIGLGKLSCESPIAHQIQLLCKEVKFMGFIENVTDCEKRQVNPNYINEIALNKSKNCVPILLSKEKKLFIQEKVKLNVPDEFKDEYLNVLFKNHEAISEHKYDLGQTETLMHDISLKSEEPVYVK
jgi:hypothetical protein